MSEPLLLLMLLVVLVLPAVLVARTGRRLGRDNRHRQQLGMWAEVRGWRLLAADEQLGRWQVWPFVAAEREVSDAIAGVHRGRDVTSRRLDTAEGQVRGSWHVLTVSLTRPELPWTLMSDGVASPGDEGTPDLEGPPGGLGRTGGPERGPTPDAPERALLRARLEAVAGEYPELSVRLEGSVLVGWLPGAPLLTELDGYLDVLTDIADAVDSR